MKSAADSKSVSLKWTPPVNLPSSAHSPSNVARLKRASPANRALSKAALTLDLIHEKSALPSKTA